MMKSDMWAAIWLILGCTLWMIFLLRSELRAACSASRSSIDTEGMQTIQQAYAPPQDLPVTKSSEPGTLGAYDPLANFAAPYLAEATPVSAPNAPSAAPSLTSPVSPFPAMTR